MRRQGLGWAELGFAHHPLVAILNVLDTILQIPALVRQGTLDSVGTARHMPLQSIGHEMDGLSDLELMTRHDNPFLAVVEAGPPLDEAGWICGPSWRKMPGKLQR